jgi:hypothetical protein
MQLRPPTHLPGYPQYGDTSIFFNSTTIVIVQNGVYCGVLLQTDDISTDD